MADEAETIERQAEAALHGAADGEIRAALGLDVVRVADATAFVAAALPPSAIVANRAIGLGLEAPPRTADLDALVQVYRNAGVERFFLHVHPDVESDALTVRLDGLGLERARGWQKFSRGVDAPVPEAAAEVAVREVGPDDGPAFARIVTDAFDLGPRAIPWFARLPSGAGWRAFLAEIDGAPAGAGALYIEGEAAWTDFGATAPAFRGRGVQGACLTHRVRVALEAGCRRLYTCTGEAVQGDPQHSFKNILRAGFEPDYVRANWAPPKRG